MATLLTAGIHSPQSYHRGDLGKDKVSSHPIIQVEEEDDDDEGDITPRTVAARCRRPRLQVETNFGLLGDIHVAGHRQEAEKTSESRDLIAIAIRSDQAGAWLKAEDIDLLVDTMAYFTFEPGEIIVRQGETGHYFFVIDEGRAEVSIFGTGVANELRRGTAFGSIALLYGCPRTATVTAKERTGVWGISGPLFRKVVQENATRHRAEIQSFMGSVRIFDGLSVEMKDAVGAIAVFTQALEPGARLVTDGELPSAMYLVRTGELSVWKGALLQGGALHGGAKVGQLAIGDVFGERCALFGEAHAETVVAETRCEIVCIGINALKRVLGENLALCLEQAFVGSIVRRQPLLASLSLSQLHVVLQRLEYQSFAPLQELPSAFLTVVLQGAVSGQWREQTLSFERGQWCQADAPDDDGQPSTQRAVSSMSLPEIGPRDGDVRLYAGGDGCRTALLTKEALAAAFAQLGLAAAQGGQGALEYLRKVLLAKEVPVFRHLSEEQVDGLVQLMVLKHFHKGTKVVQEGETGTCFFVISRGEVEVTVAGSAVRRLGRHSFFGERALLLDEQRTASVEVVSSTADVWCVEKQDFSKILTDSMREELVHRILMQDTNVSLKSLLHIRMIGKGGFGSVRLVQDRETGVRYALKRIVKDESGQIPELVARECDLLAGFDHPLILQMVAKFEVSHSLYILAELVTGGSLYEQLNRMGVLTRKQVQFYAGSVVLMLEVLRGRDIVYRDLKPENIMLDSSGFLKLIDFGLAKRLDGSRRTFSVAGTPAYMAPEVMAGHGYGVAVDIWSFGVMFFDMVLGQLPFGAGLESAMDISAAVSVGKLNFAGYNDQAGIRLIQKLLVRRPEERLGMGVDGIEEIKCMKFFKAGVTGNLFTRIMGRTLPPPAVPEGEQYTPARSLHGVSMSDAEELGG